MALASQAPKADEAPITDTTATETSIDDATDGDMNLDNVVPVPVECNSADGCLENSDEAELDEEQVRVFLDLFGFLKIQRLERLKFRRAED